MKTLKIIWSHLTYDILGVWILFISTFAAVILYSISTWINTI